jgi:hypothetical protein
MEQGNCFTSLELFFDVLNLALCILGNSFTCNNCQRSRQFMNTMKATVWGGMGPVTDGPSIKVSEEGATWNRWISSVDIIPRSSQLRHRALGKNLKPTNSQVTDPTSTRVTYRPYHI